MIPEQAQAQHFLCLDVRIIKDELQHSRSAEKAGCCWLQSGNTVFTVADFSTRTAVTIESAQQKDSLFFYCSITLNRLVQSDYFKYLTQSAAASS